VEELKPVAATTVAMLLTRPVTAQPEALPSATTVEVRVI